MMLQNAVLWPIPGCVGRCKVLPQERSDKAVPPPGCVRRCKVLPQERSDVGGGGP